MRVSAAVLLGAAAAPRARLPSSPAESPQLSGCHPQLRRRDLCAYACVMGILHTCAVACVSSDLCVSTCAYRYIFPAIFPGHMAARVGV